LKPSGGGAAVTVNSEQPIRVVVGEDEPFVREGQVLALIAEGRSNSGIADELVVTVSAVERHVTGIFDKLGLRQTPEAHRRVLAVLKYLQA
jgi:DNA-binding NarL/FixJ family response regulator